MIMQVLLQLVCVIFSFEVAQLQFQVALEVGFSPLPTRSGRRLCAAACRPGGYSVAICSMWSLSSLYCSTEREKGAGRVPKHLSQAGGLHPSGIP